MTNGNGSECGLLLTCDHGHEQRLRLHGYTEAEARHLGGIMDGTSAIYKYPPREFPIEGSAIARCQHPGCGAWFRAIPYGF